MRTKLAPFIIAVLFAACGKADAPAAGSSGAAPATSAVSAPPGEPRAEPKVDHGDKPQDLCKSIDRDALARALGVDGLSFTGGTGVKGGKDPSRTCSYYEKGKIDGGLGVGLHFIGDPTLEKRDFMGRFSWKPLDGLGGPAAIGIEKDGVQIQSVAQGVRVQLRVSHPSTPVAEIQPLAIAAMKVLLPGVPADAAARLDR
ncbi:MAG: hypothetical protein H0T89_32940 [Deltaproteobacteria bacterium]|nr:hypothetical protein [Deltaproteobacteria bacterium]MDQ3295624.1 hypothetical protein [Myxococcota bacterium]